MSSTSSLGSTTTPIIGSAPSSASFRMSQKPFQESLRRVAAGCAVFALTLVMAITGYIAFGWSLLDAVYMVVITIFGIGYGEVNPLDTPEKKIFTMFVIVAGTSAAVYIVGGVVEIFTQGDIQRALAVRRATKVIAELNQHVLICGFGRIGQMMAQQLTELKTPFLVIERDLDRLHQAANLGYITYFGDATSAEVLTAVGIYRAKAMATVLPSDPVNVLVTLTARNLNQQLLILSRGELPSTESKLRLAGANHVVMPTQTGALQIANLITRPAGLDFLDQQGDRQQLNQCLSAIDMQLHEVPVPVDSDWIGRYLNAISVQGQRQFVIIGLRRVNGCLTMGVDSSEPIANGDVLIVLGHGQDTPILVHEDQQRQRIRYRGARV
jgi:voltage-gated potassium channel